MLGSSLRPGGGLTRRDLLRVGSVGAVGLPALLQSQAAAASSAPSFGRAKRCLLLYLYGAPSQLETVDMKPDAPVEIRGSMQPIASTLPGLDVCEHLPHLARVMDKTTVVRSLHHEYPIHGIAFATTGAPATDVNLELSPADPRHHPYFGSAVEAVERQRRGGRPAEFPQNVALPFPLSTQRTGEVFRAGPYAAFLGAQFNPIWTEFVGEATGSVEKTLRDMVVDCYDPYVGCTPESHFRLATTALPAAMTLDRLNRRRSLLEQFDEARIHLEQSEEGRSLSSFQQMAFSLINSSRVARALDVRQESPTVRELYGATLFGQACLAGRRMLEAGTRLVSVFWDEYGLAGDAWDTHWNHFPRMTDQLLPGLDRAWYGLLTDLDQRGLLDDTLVVCLSEHGRTPRINQQKNGGRDHWSRAYSAMLAGGGVARGRVVGATDKQAGDVIERPVSPKDLLATMYHLLGIDPHAVLRDRTGRPTPLVPESSAVIEDVLG